MKFLLVSILAITGLIFGSEASLEEYATSNRKFASDLFREFTKSSSENLIYSPLSAQLVLTLVRLGAKGVTATELEKGLSLPSDVEALKQAVKQLQTELQGRKEYVLNCVNKAYVKVGYNIKPSYTDLVKSVFSADIENIEFADTKKASATINQYVEEKTEHLIKNLIKPELLTDLTRLILINTLYFKANWSSQFNEIFTKPQKFSKSLTESVELPLMKDTNYYKYGELPDMDAKVIQIPYIGDDVDLNVILPNKVDGLGILQNKLDKVFEPRSLTFRRVALSFPKFKIETDLNLKPILKNLGIKDVFNDKKSDLSEIAPPVPPLFVSEVIQKAYIKFTESGTTAAAATAAIIGVPYSSAPPPEPIPFTVDHPFIFYLSTKNFILFAGRVVAPQLE